VEVSDDIRVSAAEARENGPRYALNTGLFGPLCVSGLFGKGCQVATRDTLCF